MPASPQPSPASAGCDPALTLVARAPELSRWHQPRDADGRYVTLARRDLPALTSLRFFAAFFVVIHHLINMGVLWKFGSESRRDLTWYLAWGTQGHVGVTFFFVLSGFILAWCYHQAFARADDPTARRHLTRTFWHARWARVWPLHAAMFAVCLALALLDVGGIRDLIRISWTGALNLFLLHGWVPNGTRDGLAQTFNGPSWTLSCEAFFYALFPLLAVLLIRRLRWGSMQLAAAATTIWLALGALCMTVGSSPTATWFTHVFPVTRAADFVIGVLLGLLVVQHLQRRTLRGDETSDEPQPTAHRWTFIECAAVTAALASPLAWVLGLRDVAPEQLGSSWIHVPGLSAVIVVMALGRGALSRTVLAWRPLIWLGEVSYALYLTHMVLLVAVYRAGIYDRLGWLGTSALFIVDATIVAGIVHEWFEKPVRERLVKRRVAH